MNIICHVNNLSVIYDAAKVVIKNHICKSLTIFLFDSSRSQNQDLIEDNFGNYSDAFLEGEASEGEDVIDDEEGITDII